MLAEGFEGFSSLSVQLHTNNASLNLLLKASDVYQEGCHYCHASETPKYLLACCKVPLIEAASERAPSRVYLSK